MFATAPGRGHNHRFENGVISKRDSTARGFADKPSKPYPEFPLFPHATKRWAKKLRGRMHYFGPWDDPDAALKKYQDQKDALHAGRKPREVSAGVTVKDLANAYLNHKQARLDAPARFVDTQQTTTPPPTPAGILAGLPFDAPEFLSHYTQVRIPNPPELHPHRHPDHRPHGRGPARTQLTPRTPVPSNHRPLAPFELYLSEIDKTPLLNADEEHELAVRVQTGDAAARDRLVRANLRLVVSLARLYTGRGLPLEDLVAEGNMGLLRAAEGFDPHAGTRFSTYAAYWIKQSVRRAVGRDGSTVRLPSYITALVAKWHRAAADLHRELGRPAAEEEVADRLGLSPKLARAVRKALRVLASGRQADGEDAVPLDYAASDKAAPPAEELGGAEEVRKAVGSLSALTEREASVLRLRFGFDGAEPATLKEIGERMGYTRERVRQIEREALTKLRECVAA